MIAAEVGADNGRFIAAANPSTITDLCDLAERALAQDAQPSETVDGAVFNEKLSDACDAWMGDEGKFTDAYNDLVDSINAWQRSVTAKAVADERERAARLAIQWGNARNPDAGGQPNKEGKWISVNDRLPEKYEEVLVFPHPTDYCITAERDGNGFCYGEYTNNFGHETVRIPHGYTLKNMVDIVLTIAHLDHVPENCAPENLKALCQRCHLRYDAAHHAETARQTRHAAKAVAELF